MARPVDEKIVAMKMDNSDFVNKATQTTSLFGKLRDALNKIPGVNLGKSAEELQNIQANANSDKVNGLATAVQTVASRFSNLGIVAVTALQNITNRAVDAGIALGKSLTLDQVTSGFNEYELKIGAIGTMLSNTEWEGGNLNSINEVLADLNTYADNTVYSFAHMTENIGRFTAAGVGMKDSAIAIKGLSNLAAASGSDVNQLNTAMYQMSQAMAAGTMNLMDWNSLVNAGMAGKKTQDALLETAKAMGVNVDMSEGFRNSIQQGWLTSEVFLETMKKFGEDESMTEAATAVRTFTGMMDSLKESIGSGWATTFEHIFGNFDEATKFWTRLSNSVTGFFQKSTESRNNLIEKVATGGGFKNIFEGIANLAKPIGRIFDSIGRGWERIFPPKAPVEIIEMTKRFREFTEGLTIGGKTGNQLATIFEGIFSVFSSVGIIAKNLGQAILKIIPDNAGGGILTFLESIALMAIKFNDSLKAGNALTAGIGVLGGIFGTFGEVLSKIGGGVSKFASYLKNNLGEAIDWLKEKLSPIGKYFKEAFGESLGDEALGAGFLIGLGLLIKRITGFFDGLKEGVGDIIDNISDVLEGASEALNAFATGVKYANLMMIAIAVTLLAAALKTLEGIDGADLARGITALAVSLGVMMGAMLLMSKFNITGGIGAATTLILLAAAVKVMASALEDLSDIDVDKMRTGMMGLVGIVATLTASIIALSKFGGKMKTSSVGLIALAASVLILANAVELMSDIKSGDLFKSIGALTLIFAALAAFLKVVDKSKFGPGAAIGVLGVAAAIKLMADAVKDLAKLNVEQLAKGLGSIAILLTSIAAFSKIAGGPGMVTAGVGILLIAGAINALVPPIETFSKMPLGELAKGLGAMAVALVAIAGAGILATGAIGGAAAILVMALALNALIPPIEFFANMTWGEMLTAFVGLAGGMALLAGAALLLTPAVPSMLAFGAGLAVMGLAIALAGVGVAAFGVGLVTLAGLTATSIAAIVSALALLISGLASLIPAAIDFVVKLGVALVDGLVQLIPKVVEGIAKLILALLTTLAEYVPQFIEKGSELIRGVMDGIAEESGPLLESASNLILSLIENMTNVIRDNGPTFISAMMELWGEVLILVVKTGAEVINALFGWIPGVTDATSEVAETAEKTIRERFKAEDAGKDKGDEFADGLESKEGSAKTAGKGIAEAGKEAAKGVKMESAGKDFGEGFASGIGAKLGRVQTAALALARAAKAKVTSWLDIQSPSRVMMKDGGWFGEGFAIGIASKVKRVGDEAKNMAETAKESVGKFMKGMDLPDLDNEIHIKAVVEYDGLDPNELPNQVPVSLIPNMDHTSNLASASKAEIRQNAYKHPRDEKVNNTTNETINQYDIQINAQSITSRAEVRRLAEQIQTEIKNTNDRAKMSRGEVVAY